MCDRATRPLQRKRELVAPQPVQQCSSAEEGSGHATMGVARLTYMGADSLCPCTPFLNVFFEGKLGVKEDTKPLYG